MLGLGFSPAGAVLARRQQAAAALAGAARTSFASAGLTPVFHYHPNSETTSVNGSGQVTGVAANATSPELLATAAGILEQIDLRGIKRWRWEGVAAYLDLPASFDWDNRAFTLFMVGRHHKHSSTGWFFGPKYTGDGVTTANTLGGFLGVRAANSSLPAWPAIGNQLSYNQTHGDKPYMPLGAQLAVFGGASRASGYAEDGVTQPVRWYHNGRTMPGPTAVQTVAAVGGKVLTGGRTGGYLNANGVPRFDLYEIVAFKGQLTNAQCAAVCDKLMANWGIVPFTRNLVLEGDSITDGINEITTGDSKAMVLSEVGRELIPNDVRVFNTGVSGAKVAELVTRRDAVNGWPAMLLPGGAAKNLIAVQIGRNDVSAYVAANPGWTADQVGDAVFADILGYHNDATSGVVTRGWKPVQAVNVRNGNMNGIARLQARIRTDFATSVPGGAIIDLPLIQHGSNKPFDTGPFATYYQNGGSDTTHPNELGEIVMVTGADTPQHGYGAIV